MYILDEICSTLYSKEGIATAKNLKYEDVLDVLTEDVLEEITNNQEVDKDGYYYWKSDPYLEIADDLYPAILVDEKDQNVVGGISTQGRKLNVSEQVVLINQPINLTSSKITLTGTYWQLSTKPAGNAMFKKPIYQELFVPGDYYYNCYWLSSRALSISEMDQSYELWMGAFNRGWSVS